MKQNGVSDDALHLSLFPYSLTHNATAWYDRLPRNSIHTFDEMMRKFLSKYVPPSMVTKLRNEITKFTQEPHESLFEAWEHYKLYIDRCPNHNMLLVTKIDTFYNGLTLRYRDTINAATGGTYMQKTPNECYDLIENKTAHHNHWDTSVVERVPEVTKDMVQPSIENIQPPIVQTQVLIDEPIVAPKPKPTIPYPSRVTKQKLCEKDDNLALKFVEIFRKLHFNFSFAYALLHMPNFATMFKSLLNNKEKIFDLATTLLSLPELTPTQMILELADRSTTRPASIAEDVVVKVGKFHFSTDFVVVNYVVDPRVPLILGRPFLGTGRALIDVYGEELTLRVDDEAITFKVGQTPKYSYNDTDSINRIDFIDVACEEYVQEVLGFSDNSKSGNPTLTTDPIIALSSPFLEACLTSKSIPPGIDDTDFDLGKTFVFWKSY
nr:reverse transcriptase domain-containing protein [Tanacetum cinerariifolium]